MSLPTLHLLGMPHTTATRGFSVCAYTQKAVKFARMMRRIGYRVVFYWGEDHDGDADENVMVVSNAERLRWFGDVTNETVIARAQFNADSMPWRTMNKRAVDAVRRRAEPHDLLLVSQGYAHKPVADALPEMLACEWGCGYSGWYLDRVCFESHAWRHHCYGVKGIHDGRWYDTVIPNFFDEDEFPLGDGTGGYLLFVGRMIPRKGPHVAAQIAREYGLPLVLAGPGVQSWTPDRVVMDGHGHFDGADMEYVGIVGAEERARLMGDARALIVPTLYVEPFGGVAVEAQLCGTPAVATDWGAFTETVDDWFRFRTLAEAVDAVHRAGLVERRDVQSEARSRYALDEVAPQYDRWFRQLDGLWREGWYEPSAQPSTLTA